MLALMVVVVGIAVAAFRSDSNDPQRRALQLERRIACPVCDGETVDGSNASISRDIRADIAQRIQRGESDDHIMAYYRAHYERYILNPSDGGIGLVAWGLPVVAFVAAAGGLMFAIRRWRAEPRMQATDDDVALVAQAREHDVEQDR